MSLESKLLAPRKCRHPLVKCTVGVFINDDDSANQGADTRGSDCMGTLVCPFPVIGSEVMDVTSISFPSL